MRLGLEECLDRGAVGAGSGWTGVDGSSGTEGGGVGGYPCVGGGAGSGSVDCLQLDDFRRASNSFVVAAKELLVLALSVQRLPSYLLHVEQQILF